MGPLIPRVVEVLSPAERSSLCERILASLPGWFGIDSANEAYVRDVAELPTFAAWLAVDEPEPAGFLVLKIQNPYAAEIYVMGVAPGAHRRGLGTALLAAAEKYLRERGVEYLQVKTLGPSHPSTNYARTRAFYESRGFRPLEELHGRWEEGNPCLIMVKRLQ